MITTSEMYAPLWSKYRPAILQLMVASSEGPQEYKMYGHEFKGINPKEKGYAFTLQAFQGKATNNIKSSQVAKGLLSVLEMSGKASELLRANSYEFSLDKKFILHISKTSTAEKTESTAVVS